MTGDRKLRVLFVDDESRLLDGLRRAMHAYRTRWNMAFALGGGDALSQLAAEPADIIVTDMRMPGIEGALLLAEVARANTDTIRVILSGQTHATAARRAMRVAHQFLAKPIDAPTLAAAIARLETLRGLLDNGALRRLVSGASVLPAAPEPYSEVRRLCDDPGTSVAQLAEVIERDPAMTAKMLHAAGSAFFGRPLQATGMAEAVSYVGIQTLCGIVRDGELATAGCDDPALTLEVASNQLHSLLVARIARRIVPDRARADDAYAAGLLHDIGKLLLLGQPSSEQVLHAEVGAYLVGIWGLPDEIVRSVGEHHVTNRVASTNVLSAVTYAANALAGDVIGGGIWTSPPPLEESDAIGIGGSMAAWRAIAAEECTGLGMLGCRS